MIWGWSVFYLIRFMLLGVIATLGVVTAVWIAYGIRERFLNARLEQNLRRVRDDKDIALAVMDEEIQRRKWRGPDMAPWS